MEETQVAVPMMRVRGTRPLPEFKLFGSTYDLSWLESVDALVEPLGLEGVFTIRGIDESDEARESMPPFPDLAHRHPREFEVSRDYVEYLAAKDAAQAFEVTLAPEMTVLHVMHLAAQEHVRRGYNGDGQRYFWGMTLRTEDREIEFGLDS